MLKEKIQQIIQEPKAAALSVALLGMIPFFHLFGLLFMLVITLRTGAREGFVLACIVSACTAVLSLFVLHHAPKEVILPLFNPFLLWGLAVILYHSASWQRVIQLLTLVGLAIVFWIGYFYPHLVATYAKAWIDTFTTYLHQLAQVHPSLVNRVPAEDWQRAIALLGSFSLGFRPLAFVTAGLLSLLLARFIQAALYNPGGLKKELYHWHLGYGTAGFITLMWMAAYFYTTPILMGMVPVLMLPLLCNGFSLVHCLTAGYKHQLIVLVVFYACVLLLLQQLLLFVLLLGYVDCFINFRKYMKK